MSICINPNCQSDFIPLSGSKGKYCSLSCGTSHRNEIGRQNRLEEYNRNPKLCLSCDSPLNYTKYKNKNVYCNHSCATSHTNCGRVASGWIHPAKKTDEEKKVTVRLRMERNKLNKAHSPKKPRTKLACTKPRNTTYIQKSCPECGILFTLPLSKKGTKYCSDVCRQPHKGGFRSTSQITKTIHYYNEDRFDSGAEVLFAKLCDQNNITWERNSGQFKFPYVDNKGKTRHYYPDFLLTTLNTFVEIKGKRFLNESTYLKLKAVDRPIELVMSTDICLFILRVCASMPIV